MTLEELDERLALDSLGLLPAADRIESLPWEALRSGFDEVVEYLSYLPPQTAPSPHLKRVVLAALRARDSLTV